MTGIEHVEGRAAFIADFHAARGRDPALMEPRGDCLLHRFDRGRPRGMRTARLPALVLIFGGDADRRIEHDLAGAGADGMAGGRRRGRGDDLAFGLVMELGFLRGKWLGAGDEMRGDEGADVLALPLRVLVIRASATGGCTLGGGDLVDCLDRP